MRFVYPPTLPYHQMTQRPQQLARALVKLGHEFFFFEKEHTGGKSELHDGVHVVRSHDMLHDLLPESVLFCSWSIHHALADQAAVSVFDNLDFFPQWERDDRILAEKSDIIIVSSLRLFDRMVTWGRSDAHMVPNACEFDHWQNPAPWEPSADKEIDVKKLQPPVAIFSGAVAEWVNIELIKETAKLLPDVKFLIIGPNWTSLQTKENVYCLSEFSYDELPNIFGHASVGIIPFHINDITLAADPIKQYEYAAAGLPVVSTQLPETKINQMLDDSRYQLYPDGSPGDFARRIRHALDNFTPECGRKIKQWALAHTWEKRAMRIQQIIYRYLMEGSASCD